MSKPRRSPPDNVARTATADLPAPERMAAIAAANMSPNEIDAITREVTAFESLADLCGDGYTPTLASGSRGAARFREETLVADAFDAVMAVRGEERRAWRGTRK